MGSRSRTSSAAPAGWEWDVALLQEVPPWWPPHLAAATGAEQRLVLTSRNFGLGLRRAISSRNPDILKSNGGGANAILVRGPIAEHRKIRLNRRPSRAGPTACGWPTARGWSTSIPPPMSRPRAARTLQGARAAREWAGGARLLFGGDINIHGKPELPGLVRLGGNHVDHLYSEGRPAQSAEVLERGRLSDHPPVRVTL